MVTAELVIIYRERGVEIIVPSPRRRFHCTTSIISHSIPTNGSLINMYWKAMKIDYGVGKCLTYHVLKLTDLRVRHREPIERPSEGHADQLLVQGKLNHDYPSDGQPEVNPGFEGGA